VDLTGADVRSQESTETEARFRTLKEKWYRETGMLSFIDEKVIHPAYQMIIGMGEAALPYIFEEMRSNRGDWFWALNAITRGVTPAPGAPTFRNAVLAWLKWGEEQGYIKHEWETQR